MSGSPIFGEFNINGLIKYKFIGIVRGGAENITEAIKAKEILNTLHIGR
jgi:hypothetical protein